MNKLLSTLCAVSIVLLSSTSAFALVTKITSFDTHGDYIELGVADVACANLTSTWQRKVRVLHSDASRAEFVAKIALAAILSGKTVSLEAYESNGRCYVSVLQISP